MAGWDKVVDVLADFDATTDVDGSLLDAAAAMHEGLTGLELTFDDDNVAVGKTSLLVPDETTGVISFAVNLNDVALDANKNISFATLYDGTDTSQWAVQIQNVATQHKIRFGYKDDGGTTQWPAALTKNISLDTWYECVYMFKAATEAGANDGVCEVSIDGALFGSVTNADNDTKDWDYATIGMAYTASVGFGGSYYIDTIKIRKWEELVSLTAQSRDFELRTAEKDLALMAPERDTQLRSRPMMFVAGATGISGFNILAQTGWNILAQSGYDILTYPELSYHKSLMGPERDANFIARRTQWAI